VNPDAVDTTGFFDEIALLLGNNFKTLSFVSNQIKYIQNKGYTNVKLELSKKNQKEIQQLTSFCKTLHDYSFVAKYHYQKKRQKHSINTSNSS
jgi:spore germination protein YaaH